MKLPIELHYNDVVGVYPGKLDTSKIVINVPIRQTKFCEIGLEALKDLLWMIPNDEKSILLSVEQKKKENCLVIKTSNSVYWLARRKDERFKPFKVKKAGGR